MTESLSSARGGSIIAVPRSALGTLDSCAALEWLETDGRGDFACGTVAGPNTRRRHGLFTAAGPKPMLLLAALDVALERDGERHDLSTYQYADTVHPQGWRALERFALDPFPAWTWRVPGAGLTQRLFMPRGTRALIAAWTLEAGSAHTAWRLKVRPLFAYREADRLTRANPHADLALRGNDGVFTLAPYAGCPPCLISALDARMRHDPLWYRRFLHTLDTGEGVESEEDLFTPCELEHDLPPGATVFLSVGLEAPASSPATIMESERRRRMALTLPGLAGDATANILARAAEAFIVEEPSKRARLVTAYPDTAEDLRAAMIALPGLLLATRRLDAARTVLLDAAERLSARADGADDAALWFMRACELYGDHSRDWPLVRDSLVPACAALAERYAAHRDGAGFALAPDGLLCSAAAEGGLTWMDDAARAGKPVEVNALWRNALGWLARWSDRRGEADTARRFSDLHDLSGRAFRHRFWDESAARLRDTVDGPAADAAIRPNQVFALVLGGDLLDRRQATTILGQVEMRLLTAHGLRTLSLEDLGFVAEVAGPAAARAGRHSGAAYPWLIGPHVDAILRVHGRTVRAYARTEVCMQGLIQEQLQQGCLGQIPEMFDGAAPHAPHGAFAHAPAVGELLRAYAEVRGRLL